MILVDTSVLVNYLKGKEDNKTLIFHEIISNEIPYGISLYTYQEVLQGAKSEKEYSLLKEYLGSQRIYSLPQTLEIFEAAARMYFDLRRKGVTVRGSIDILIALTAIRYDLVLLHDDRDFDNIVSATKDLRSMAGI